MGHYGEFFAKGKTSAETALCCCIRRQDEPAGQGEILADDTSPGAYSPALSEVFTARSEQLWVTDSVPARAHATSAALAAEVSRRPRASAQLTMSGSADVGVLPISAEMMSDRLAGSFPDALAKKRDAAPIVRDTSPTAAEHDSLRARRWRRRGATYPASAADLHGGSAGGRVQAAGAGGTRLRRCVRNLPKHARPSLAPSIVGRFAKEWQTWSPGSTRAWMTVNGALR